MLNRRSSLLSLLLCLALASLAAAQDTTAKKAVDGTPFIEASELESGAVDFGKLNADQKRRAVQLLNDNLCDCGCKMSLARCRRDDKSCPRSPQVAPALVAALAAGKTDAEAVAAGLAVAEARITFPVTAGDSPSLGPANAPVTMIVWLDYQCPFCAKVHPVLEEIVAKYPKDVRLVIKMNPLSMHDQAQFAAEAALAANAQGKFWDLHRKMLANTRDVNPDKIRGWAAESGMDVARMDAEIASGKYKTQVAAEQAFIVGLGATGTPASFINGRYVTGAKDFAYFAKRIDEEIGWAKAGNRPQFTMGKNVSELKPAPKGGGKPDPTKRYDIKPGTTPPTGASNAKVDIVLWTDYQCPFCKRVEPELEKVLTDNPDTVRMFVRQHPLGMHADAMPAAQAALAAADQGKFWEMHDKLFEDSPNLKRADFERHAEELGLDMTRFRQALDTNAHAADIKADMDAAVALKATFTPAIFVGGYLVEGGGSAVQAKVNELLGKGAPATVSAPVTTAAAPEAAAAPASTRATGSPRSMDVTAEAMKLAAELLASLQGDLDGSSDGKKPSEKGKSGGK